MAGPAYYTGQINIAKNDDWAVSFLYSSVNSDGVTTTPIDLTGSTIKMEIRIQESDHEATVGLTSADINMDGYSDGIYITDAVGGAFTVVITRHQSMSLYPGSYITDIVRLMPNGYQERLWEGTVTVVEGTTR
jgi:hypothetical protein